MLPLLVVSFLKRGMKQIASWPLDVQAMARHESFEEWMEDETERIDAARSSVQGAEEWIEEGTPIKEEKPEGQLSEAEGNIDDGESAIPRQEYERSEGIDQRAERNQGEQEAMIAEPEHPEPVAEPEHEEESAGPANIEEGVEEGANAIQQEPESPGKQKRPAEIQAREEPQERPFGEEEQAEQEQKEEKAEKEEEEEDHGWILGWAMQAVNRVAKTHVAKQAQNHLEDALADIDGLLGGEGKYKESEDPQTSNWEGGASAPSVTTEIASGDSQKSKEEAKCNRKEWEQEEYGDADEERPLAKAASTFGGWLGRGLNLVSKLENKIAESGSNALNALGSVLEADEESCAAGQRGSASDEEVTFQGLFDELGGSRTMRELKVMSEEAAMDLREAQSDADECIGVCEAILKGERGHDCSGNEDDELRSAREAVKHARQSAERSANELEANMSADADREAGDFGEELPGSDGKMAAGKMAKGILGKGYRAAVEKVAEAMAVGTGNIMAIARSAAEEKGGARVDVSWPAEKETRSAMVRNELNEIEQAVSHTCHCFCSSLRKVGRWLPCNELPCREALLLFAV